VELVHTLQEEINISYSLKLQRVFVSIFIVFIFFYFWGGALIRNYCATVTLACKHIKHSPLVLMYVCSVCTLLIISFLQVFLEQLLVKTKELFPSVQNESLSDYLIHSHAANAYDAVWALALAWNSTFPTLLSEQFSKEQEDSRLAISEELKQSMQRTAFEGIAVSQRVNQQAMYVLRLNVLLLLILSHNVK